MSWIKRSWEQYKYRFVPWILLNLKSNTRIRRIKPSNEDKLIPDSKIVYYLREYYRALEDSNPFVPEQLKPKPALLRDVACRNKALTLRRLGFAIERLDSGTERVGKGVFVTEGSVPERSVVALYPGTVYQAYEPILFQSIANKFVFKCSDSCLVDGNDRGLSRLVYKSLSERDRVGPRRVCDQSWLTSTPWNPLAVGQYVNNEGEKRRANVAYQELDLPDDFPLELLRYHCNVTYSGRESGGYKTVALVSLRRIARGEELLSTYFTLISS